MSDEGFVIGIDVGAGLGVKTGLFTDPLRQFGSRLLERANFDDNFDDFLKHLVSTLEVLTKENDRKLHQADAIGIASPGLFASDGSYLLSANLPFLTGENVQRRLAEISGLPVAIDNDANAGGLAEWFILRTDLLYWVLGGGWGGTWINKQGDVMYPALDWDGNDQSLHHTDEPGYSIPLAKLSLKPLFYEFGASFERFEQIVIEDMALSEGQLAGPGANQDTIRAEVVLSGPGRCRLFRAMVGDDDFYQRFLEINENDQMSDPSVAGRHISKLSEMRVESAVNTDRLFGRLLAMAAQILFRQARNDGLPEGVPICLGGKPSYALPYFGPAAQGRMGAMGIMSYLRPSVIDERGLNANLVGASVLAAKTFAARQSAAVELSTEENNRPR